MNSRTAREIKKSKKVIARYLLWRRAPLVLTTPGREGAPLVVQRQILWRR
jgi:hypothetical protein